MAGAGSGGRPGRPTEESGQLADLFRIPNGVRPQAEFRGRLAEERCIVRLALVESMYLRIRVNQRARGIVIPVGLEVLYCPASGCIGVRAAVELDARKRGAMQILCREIRSQIRAMAKDRAVLHQAIAQKNLLPCHNVLAGKQRRSICALDYVRYGRLVVIGVIGKHAQDEETENQHNGGCLHPTARNHQRILFTCIHMSPLNLNS